LLPSIGLVLHKYLPRYQNIFATQCNTIYLDGNGSCIAGIIDSVGCWLGDAPAGTTAFYYTPTNGFYYAEP
jgi:hypothetical protein